MTSRLLILVVAVAFSAAGAPVEWRQTSGCSNYVIIDTRGTGEAQGPSAGFGTMNSNVLAQIPGGSVYNTVYPADYSQNSEQGTQDIVNHVTSTLQSNPNTCFILEGYSQGAAATVNALSRLSGSAFDAVKGVFLIGDPEHKAGLTCNVDNNGGTTTRNVNGISAGYSSGGIPDNWVSKTLDVCIAGDGICDASSGYGVTSQHLQYPNDAPTQNLGTSFIEKALQGAGGSSPPSSGGGGGGYPSGGYPGGGYPGGGYPGGGYPGGGYGSTGFPAYTATHKNADQ